jgi:hypothetical protein
MVNELDAPRQTHRHDAGFMNASDQDSALQNQNCKYVPTLLQTEQVAAALRRDFISESCCLAAEIYWNALSAEIPFIAAANGDTVRRLYTSLSQTDQERWMENAPLMHAWVCFVGALAANAISERAWFVARSKTSVVTMNPESVECFRDGVSHLLWLSKYLQSRHI